MEMPKFTGDEDKDEINHMEWLKLVKEYNMNHTKARDYFFDEAWKWWMSVDQNTRWYCKWEEFEILFSDKWIRDTKMEEMFRIQDELIEAKKEIKKEGKELSKIISLNESLIKEVKNLKQEKTSKGKWEKDESREDLKKKYEEIYRLRSHNKKLLDKVKRLKEEKKNYQNKEERRILNEEYTKRLQEEICKKVEESLNMDEVKSKIQARIEEGRQNLLDGITLQLQKKKENKIQEGQQNILEEAELHIEDVHAKYDGIISKAGVIKDKAKMIDDSIVVEKKMDEMHVHSERRPSSVKPYRHSHYQETFQGRQEGRYQHHEGRR
jgi:DNA repair exonuclease SbcCD ATPase subunit